MKNPWIEHVRAFAKKKGLTYFQALRDPDVKKGYKKKVGGTVSQSGMNNSEDIRLRQRFQQFFDMIDMIEDQHLITPLYADSLRRDSYVLANDTRMSISEKHDILTNLLKEVRTITDEQLYGKPQPHAF